MSNSSNGSSGTGGGGSWWSRMSRSEQVMAAILGAVVAGVFGVIVALISRSSGSSPDAPPNANSTTVASSSPVVNKSESLPLTFNALSHPESEGKVVPVTLSGTVPGGEHLWIFVHHAGRYYVQGTPASQGPNLWYLPAVNLGSTLKSDRNSWYTIYAVQANPQANSAIKAEYNNINEVNYGLTVIPGGSGAKKVAYINVYRSH
jgi:hypothetical protein